MALEQSIREELARLIKENVDGITTAPAYSPRTVQDAHLPIVIITPSRARYERLGSEVYALARDYTILLLAARMTTGGTGEAEAVALDFIEPMRGYLLGLQRIEADHKAVEAVLTADGGLSVFTRDAGENAAYFAGIEFTLTTLTRIYAPDNGV